MRTLQLGDDIRELAFPIGQTVYLRMQDEKRRGMITGYMVDDSSVMFRVAWGNATDSIHYAIELTATYQPEFIADAAEEGRE